VLQALLIGSLTTVVNLAIQVMAILLILRRLQRRLDARSGDTELRLRSMVLGSVLVGLFVGHLLQFATWAAVFLVLGEFSDFKTAFYHSAVNFAALGYGDIVMSDEWRLLGPLEATNGVLMLGLSAGTVLSVMNSMLSKHEVFKQLRKTLSE
jgi:hypothetical protein